MALTSVVTAVSTPITVAGDKMGAGTFLKYNGYTAIVYQSQDTAINGLYGSGIPTTVGTYTTTQLLAPGVARNDTPLAIVSVGNSYVSTSSRLQPHSLKPPHRAALAEWRPERPEHLFLQRQQHAVRHRYVLVCSAGAGPGLPDPCGVHGGEYGVFEGSV